MNRADKAFPYLLILPSLIVVLFVLIIPLFFCVYCSVYACKYMSFSNFVGIENYIKAFTNPTYLRSFERSFLFSLASLAISLGFGLFLALWTHRHTNKIVSYSIQMVGLIPWVTSQVVGSMLWKWLLNEEYGLVNYGIRLLNGQSLAFFSNRQTAIAMLIFIMAWRTTGYAMVNILAGLKGIPTSVEEAALIDGANSWTRLIYVRLPLIKTQILISTIIISLSNLNNLTVPLALTGGGPGSATSVITLTIYELSFSNFQFGRASALSIILFMVTFLLSLIYVKAVKYDV